MHAINPLAYLRRMQARAYIARVLAAQDFARRCAIVAGK